jgi:hypothetical protein
MSAKPKSLRYREALDAVEQRIVDALPEIVDGLINRAKEGDAKAAFYLVDRILGKAAGASTLPTDDKRLPYTEVDFDLEQRELDSNRDRRLRIARILSGAEKGA